MPFNLLWLLLGLGIVLLDLGDKPSASTTCVLRPLSRHSHEPFVNQELRQERPPRHTVVILRLRSFVAEELRFEGIDGDECERFIRAVRIYALAEGKQVRVLSAVSFH